MAASRSPPDLKPQLLEKCEEFDEKRRECQVWFYAAPIREDWKTNADGTPAVHLFHWAITVYFPRGDRYFTFEGIKEDGKLEATRTNGTPIDFSMQEYLGTVSTSPADLLKEAQRNAYNGKTYSSKFRNCQTWIKEFAKSFGEGIRSKVDKFKTYLETVGAEKAMHDLHGFKFAYAASFAMSRSSMASSRGVSSSSSSRSSRWSS